MFATWLAAASIFAFYGVVLIANLANIQFSTLIWGRGLVKQTIDIVLISRELDLTIWLSSVAVLAGVYIYNFRRQRLGRLMLLVIPLALAIIYPGPLTLAFLASAGTVLVVSLLRKPPDPVSSSKAILGFFALLMAILVPLELASSARWIMHGIIGGFPLSDPSWKLALIELQLFNIPTPILPRVFVLFLSAWILRLAWPYYAYIFRSLVSKFGMKVDIKASQLSVAQESVGGGALLARIFIILTLASAVILGLYPYSAINSSGRLVGVDTPFYLAKVGEILGPGSSISIEASLSDQRSLSHILNSLLAAALGSAEAALKILPTVLASIFGLTTYLLVKSGTKYPALAAFAALLSVLSYPTTVGVNAGFYANWLALSLVTTCFWSLIRSIETHSRFYASLSMLTSVAVLYTHPWTWLILMMILAVYGLLTFRLRGGSFRTTWDFRLIIVTLGLNMLADLIKSNLTIGSGAVAATTTATSALRLMDWSYVLGVLEFTFVNFLGGALVNTALLLLAALGFFAIGSPRYNFNRLLLSWGTISSIGILFFGSPDQLQHFLYARSMYLIPFHIFAAIGTMTLVRISRSSVGGAQPFLNRFLSWGLLTFVLSMLLNYSLRVLSSLFPHIR